MQIFLAAPFTDKVDPATKLITQPYRAWIEAIIRHLKSKGHSVTSSHTREEWGAKLEAPEIAIQNDFNGVRECDLLIAHPGNPPSPGVHMELGFAVAFKKPIIVIHENQTGLPYLDHGLSRLTETFEISYTNQDQLLEELTKELVSVTKVLKGKNTPIGGA